jgi:hypothetical protein
MAEENNILLEELHTPLNASDICKEQDALREAERGIILIVVVVGGGGGGVCVCVCVCVFSILVS